MNRMSDRTPYRPREAALVLATMIAASATLNAVSMPLAQVADPVRTSFGISDVQFSLLLGLFAAVPSMVMSVGGGWLVDRMSRRRLLLIIMMVWTLGGIWSALATGYWQLAASRMLIAAASGIKFPLAITWINDAFPPERRGRAVGAFFVVLGVGPAIGAALGGYVVQSAESGRLAGLLAGAHFEPWRAALLALALTNVVVLPVAASLKDVRGVQTKASPAAEIATRRRYPLLFVVLIVVAVSLLQLGDQANLAWLPTVLRRQYAFGAQEVGMTFGVITTIGGVVGSLAGGFVGDWIFVRRGTQGRLWACAAAASISALLLLSYALQDVRILVWTLVFNAVFSVMAMTLGYVVFQALLPPDRRGFGIGLGGAVTILVSSSGPTLVALVAALLPTAPSSLGIAIALVTMTALAIAAALYTIVAMLVARSARRDVPGVGFGTAVAS